MPHNQAPTTDGPDPSRPRLDCVKEAHGSAEIKLPGKALERFKLICATSSVAPVAPPSLGHQESILLG